MPVSAQPSAPASTAAHSRAAAGPGRAPAAWTAALPDVALVALRVISALVLLQHGLQKLFGFPANPARPWDGAPAAFTQSWNAGVLELVGGVLLVFGLFTRPVAFVLSGLMAAAYFLVHAPRGFYPVLNRGEPAVLLCFVFLYLAAVGPGALSLDALRRRRRAGAPAASDAGR